MAMQSDTIKQNFIYIITVILVFAILMVLKPTSKFQVYGIALPVTKLLPKERSKQVTLYQVLPVEYKNLAQIHVQAHTLKPTKGEERQVIQYAQQLAQKIGANGLIITNFGYNGPSASVPAPLAKYVLFAKAIKTNESN